MGQRPSRPTESAEARSANSKLWCMQEPSCLEFLDEAWQEHTLELGQRESTGHWGHEGLGPDSVRQGSTPEHEAGKWCCQMCLQVRPHGQPWTMWLKEANDSWCGTGSQSGYFFEILWGAINGKHNLSPNMLNQWPEKLKLINDSPEYFRAKPYNRKKCKLHWAREAMHVSQLSTSAHGLLHVLLHPTKAVLSSAKL